MDCSHLLALAILLLEVSSGRSIETERRPEDMGNETSTNEKTDRETANRWLKEERRRLSPGYRKAILACLQEHINPDANFADSKYCNTLKDKIIQPLEDEMYYMMAS